MKKIILNFVFILNIIKLIYSTYEFGELANFTNNIAISYSMEKDMGRCSCNLSPYCDYNCPCDSSCTEEDIKKFDEDERDKFKYFKERLSDYLCLNKQDKFNYNKNKAGISVKDHIFSLMCIHKDNSPDMGEFYEEEPKPNNAADDWKNEFFKSNNEENNEGNIELYKPDSNGYCIKSNISINKNNKFSCIDINDIVGGGFGFTKIQYGDNTIGIKDNAPSNTNASYYTNNKTKIINFNISWNIDENEGNTRPKGYMQGTPLKIKTNDQEYDRYYLPIIDSKGNCINENEENNTISFQPLIFKNNVIYSCIFNNNLRNIKIYQFLCESQTKICPTPDDKCDNTKNIIDCSEFDPDIIDGNVNIQLKIYSYKEGKESSPHEIIVNQKVYIDENSNNNGENEKKILTLKIKYIDVSSSSYYNTKDGKITSLIPLSDEELDAITVNDK